MTKSIFSTFAFLLLTVAAGAQTMNVHRKSGEVLNIPLDDVEFVDFSAASPLVPVDLGLPSGTQWGNMNVGATKPEEYGLFFAWGETEGYGSDPSDGHSFGWDQYKFCGGDNGSLTKYSAVEGFGVVDYKTHLELVDDAASANCGFRWVMPTYADVLELLNYTTTEWIEVNGINCRKFVSKVNGNSILLPAAGGRAGNNYPSAVGNNGCYWTSTLLDGGDPRSAYTLEFDWGDATWGAEHRYCGCSVRPVKGPTR